MEWKNKEEEKSANYSTTHTNIILINEHVRREEHKMVM
jgi:hypothetical protein